MVPTEAIGSVLKELNPGELTALTSDLVRINSVWDPEVGNNEQRVAEHVAAWADNQGFRVEIDEVVNGRPNVIIEWVTGPGERVLMFEGHTDVVTPGDMSVWHHDPFGAEIVGRRMYGRGTNDTKGNLSAMLIAMAALKRSGVRLSGTIVGGALCDEEGGMIGVLDFIKRGHADKVTGAIICEPQDGLICNSQKGAIRVRYTIRGHMSHGAMPLSGLNTAPAIAALIEGLQEMEIRAVESLGRDKYLGWPSFTPTVIRAPSIGTPQLNVIPDEAEILVDVRTIPRQSHSVIRNDLSELAAETEKRLRDHFIAYDRRLNVDRDRDLKIQTDILTDRPCTVTDLQDPVVQAADWATKQISGNDPVHGGVPGTTDGTFLWALKGIPIVTMGAGARHIPHQVDEWVDLDQLIETAKIYALTGLYYLYPK